MVPEKSVLLSNCEVELRELMKQIDIMVHSQRAKWEQDRKSLQTRLEHTQQELTLQKVSLEYKDQEVCTHTVTYTWSLLVTNSTCIRILELCSREGQAKTRI